MAGFGTHNLGSAIRGWLGAKILCRPNVRFKWHKHWPAWDYFVVTWDDAP